MNESLFILEILKYAAAGLIVFFVAWYFVRQYLSQKLNVQLLDIKKESLRQTLPLRLQAYERIVIFLERINPVNMLVRLHESGMTSKQLQQMVINEIRSEYQHNISQQIYVDNNTWEVVKRIKEDSIALISNAANALPEDASALELSKSVLLHLANLESENPYEMAIILVKREIHTIF